MTDATDLTAPAKIFKAKFNTGKSDKAAEAVLLEVQQPQPVRFLLGQPLVVTLLLAPLSPQLLQPRLPLPPPAAQGKSAEKL